MHGVYGGVEWCSSPWPWAEPLLAERCAGPTPVRWVSGRKSGKALLREQLHTPFKLESAGSLSGYISTCKIFAISLCPSHPNISLDPKKEAPLAVLTVTRSYVGAGDCKKWQFANIMSRGGDWFLCSELMLCFRLQHARCWEGQGLPLPTNEKGLWPGPAPARLPKSSPVAGSLLQQSTAWKLVFPTCRNSLFLKGLSMSLNLHPSQVQGKIEGCKSPVVQHQ